MRAGILTLLRFLCASLLFACLGQAHVGSPDVFFEGKAGPYPVSIAIRPPTVIPGIAEVEIRTSEPTVRTIEVVPFPLVGVASKYPPTPDVAKRSGDDPRYFTSSVWLMGHGSYQIRVSAEGSLGRGALSVPIPAIARETKDMQRNLGWMLAGMMVFIVAGAVSIAGAAVREATLPVGAIPDAGRRRTSRLVMAATALVAVAILRLGYWWWSLEARSYRSHVYVPPPLTASVEGKTLHLRVEESTWAIRPKIDDYLPDHGHMMHLFVVRMPQMEQMWHLHPTQVGKREFTLPLPPMQAGHYKLFADVVHASGFPETPVTDFNLDTAVEGAALQGDDVAGAAPPLSVFDPARTSFVFPDGLRVVLVNKNLKLVARQLHHFTVEVQDRSGRPVTDLQLYMGMAAHAEFLLTDGSVFAHVHPSGTVPMSALGLTAEAKDAPMKMQGMNPAMPMDMLHGDPIPAQITFPYGFPKAGRYRMFLQIQRGGTPRTASFDFDVQDPKS